MFLVDTPKLRAQKDVLADDNGKWKWGGQAKTSYIVHEGENGLDIAYHDLGGNTNLSDNNQQQDGEGSMYVLKRSYWKHKTADGKMSFRRSITSVKIEDTGPNHIQELNITRSKT